MQKQKLTEQYYAKLAEYDLEGIDPSGALLMKFERGEWFLREDEPIEYLLILLSGKAKICTSEKGGRNLLLCYYVSEGIMGDVELLMGRHEAISSVQAVTALSCIALPVSTYGSVLLSNLPFVLRLANGLSKKLHTSVADMTEIILRPFEARLCGYVLANAQNGLFSERLTDVSEQLGVSYRHLLRSLKSLCIEGILEKSDVGYRIQNESALREKAAG